MFVFLTIHKRKLIYTFIFIVLISLLLLFYGYPLVLDSFSEKETSKEIEDLFKIRNDALLKEDIKTLQGLYNQNIRYGIWAYEHELKKMKYLHQWSYKQGVKFIDISSKIMVRRAEEREDNLLVNLTVSTTYKYVYENDPKKVNLSRIGTYHSLNLSKKDHKWIINREWYTDPFADSLHLDDIKGEDIKNYIISAESRDFSNLIDRRRSAIAYADRYCGAAAKEDYHYNQKYKNYNPQGGDCTNFASQILYEGGSFKKNYTWNYEKDGSKAWVNAQAFKNYMIYSGRASVIAYGSYDKVYKAAYNMKPGDFVAYEKKGKVIHISVTTAADSKGYPLVNSHNTDRYRVPWDLGWSDKGIKFWLVHVHF